ncbi:DNA circularization protein [Jeongeupia chitinilytica]|uniref:DNA circulation N-terminal domain-containing protein n=1 Tax=Jeongeupia chitinilytica TaxID=1041641 RepID=A0ABQ3GZU8_9NEIS|nr:DNA circularization N-terminal domain-containing protein [Jeongeupia chitinilytica]GHD60405.1 hypothetical protein GCM10007350_13390 [Jeongeupia chitinilytica]
MAGPSKYEQWRRTLKPASWRGIRFMVEDCLESGGRRVDVSEYPFRDAPFVVDLGAKAGELLVSGYLLASELGAALWPTSQQLFDALQSDGSPGELVLPEGGAQQRRPMGIARRTCSGDPGIVRFDLTFAPLGKNEFPTRTADAQSGVRDAGAATVDGATASMASVWSVVGQSSAALEKLANQVEGYVDQLTELAGMGDLLSGLNDLILQGTRISNDIARLIRAPEELAQQLTSMTASVGRMFSRPADAVRSYQTFFDGLRPKGTPRASTPQPAQPKAGVPRDPYSLAAPPDNSRALTELMERSCLSEAGILLPSATYTTWDDARAACDQLVQRIDRIQPAAPDAVYEPMSLLRLGLLSTVPDPTERLPRLVTVTPPTTLPALVLAYTYCGDPYQADDLVQRNGISRPGFVPGNKPLQIIVSQQLMAGET